jgi:hypothetical protein
MTSTSEIFMPVMRINFNIVHNKDYLLQSMQNDPQASDTNLSHAKYSI